MRNGAGQMHGRASTFLASLPTRLPLSRRLFAASCRSRCKRSATAAACGASGAATRHRWTAPRRATSPQAARPRASVPIRIATRLQIARSGSAARRRGERSSSWRGAACGRHAEQHVERWQATRMKPRLRHIWHAQWVSAPRNGSPQPVAPAPLGHCAQARPHRNTRLQGDSVPSAPFRYRSTTAASTLRRHCECALACEACIDLYCAGSLPARGSITTWCMITL